MSHLLCVTLALTLTASVAAQDSHPLTVTVAAGKHDRRQTPVKVAVTIPKSLRGALIVPLKTESGQPIFGQLSASGGLAAEQRTAPADTVARYLYFVLPELSAGKSLTLTGNVTLDIQKPPAVFVWKDSAGQFAELAYGERPVLKYMYASLDETTPETRAVTYKPYHHVYDPQGKFLITKGPGGLFPHHRGLFFGFNRISYDGKTADTWHCNNGECQSHQGFLTAEAGPVFGRHVVQIDWHGKDKNVFARERREMTVYAAAGGNLIEFASHLESTVGPVRLDGDPQHAGFQFRATQEVPDKTAKLTYYVRPDGKGEPGKFRNWDAKTRDVKTVNLPWHALSFVVGEQRYTCCYLDRPQNPKEARYSERDYGRFGSYFEYELDKDRPLDISYRIWLQEGEMSGGEVQRLADDFVEPPAATAK
jgi:methane monooxygenase PmoA-like